MTNVKGCAAFLLIAGLWGCQPPATPSPRPPATAADSQRINRLLDKSWFWRDRNVDSSRACAAEARRLAHNAGNLKGEAEALNRLANTEDVQGHYDSAVSFFSAAFRIDSIRADTYGMGRDVYQLSILLKKKGTYTTALRAAQKAVTLFGQLPKQQTLLALACIAEGNIYHRQGRYDDALNSFFRARDIALRQGSVSLEASVYNSIGLVYEKEALYERALQMYEKSYRICDSLQDEQGMASAGNNIGNIRYYEGKPKMALQWYRKSIALREKAGWTDELPALYSNVGIIYEAIHELDTALVFHTKALDSYDSTSDVQSLAISYNNAGVVLRKLGRLKEAIHDFLLCVEKAKHSETRFILTEALDNLAEVYAETGDYTSAFHYTQEYQLVRDSLESRLRKATEVDISYKEEQSKRILLEKEQEKQYARIQRQRLLLFGSGGIIFLLLLFIGALWRSERQKRRALQAEQLEKQNRQRIEELMRDQEIATLRAVLENQEQERKRIAKDLHDRLGIKLSTAKLYYNLPGVNLNELSDEEQQQIKKGNEMLDEAVTELRKVAHNLVDGKLMKLGLVIALRNLCQSIAESTQLRVDFHAFGMDDRLENSIEISLYAITQELLTNILKHAVATEITVQINRYNGTLNLMVEDNGIGFDSTEKKTGMGLKNIAERVGELGGQLQIDSLSGKGTTVTIDISLHSS